MSKAEVYLESSPTRAGGSEKVGKLPASIELHDLRLLGHPVSPIRAIRAKCIDCSGGNAAEARKCVAFRCPLWAFRMGFNPFHGKAAGHRQDRPADAWSDQETGAEVAPRPRQRDANVEA